MPNLSGNFILSGTFNLNLLKDMNTELCCHHSPSRFNRILNLLLDMVCSMHVHERSLQSCNLGFLFIYVFDMQVSKFGV